MSQHRALLRRSLSVLWSFALLSGTAIHARPDAQAEIRASTLSIEDAIATARRCLRARDVNVAGKFVESAVFRRIQRDDRGPYWTVTWARARDATADRPMVVGGEVIVSVFQNSRCELRHGE